MSAPLRLLSLVGMTTIEPVTVLSACESWELLSGAALGRLVTSVDGQPEIFPVNFVVQDRTVLFRTAEGTKLVSSAINNRVLFEADGHGASGGWSHQPNAAGSNGRFFVDVCPRRDQR